MKLKSMKEVMAQSGRMIMIYGETGCGKTTSILQSAPNPIYYIQTEPRSLKPSIEAADRSDLKLFVAQYENFDDLLEFVSKAENFEKFNTVVIDGFTHLTNVALLLEIAQESFEAKKEKDQLIKPLINKTKLSMEGYGGLSGNMFRLSNCLMNLSAQYGKVVIVTALLTEHPKYDRELVAAPALKGREYPDAMPEFFDLIGLVRRRYKDGKPVYPPAVYFESPDNSYLCKYTGRKKNPNKLAMGPLNFSKILKPYNINQH